MNKFLKRGILVLLIFGIFSCRTAKELDREATIYRKPEKVIGLTKNNDLLFNTATLKANVTISEGKQKLSFKANIRMEKDSVIWSSLSILGIAGAKTLMTQDSIKVVNYKDRNYINEAYSKLQDYLNSDILSLGNLQKIMLGDWLYISDFEKYRMKYNEKEYVVSTMSERRLEKDWMEKKIDKLEKKYEKKEEKDAEKAQENLEKKQDRNPRKYDGLAIEVLIDPFDLKVKRMFVKDYYFNGELTTEYSDFKMVNNSMFPHTVNITLNGKKKLGVEIEYYKITLDQEISTPFSIPKKYERLRL